MKLILNPSSETLIKSLVDNLPQSLLLSGPYGIGLTTIAKNIAASYDGFPLLILPEKDEQIDLDKGIIGVELMRQLYEQTASKYNQPKIIIIDYAETMSLQAQNAFLKLLEEPNQYIHFILLSHSVNKLLPTILSRVERVDLLPVGRQQSEQLLDQLGIQDQTKRSQLLFMADGLPAELSRLAQDMAYFEQRSQSVRAARDLISGSEYQKLLIAQRYKDDRQMVLQILLDAANILRLSIIDHPQPVILNRIEKILDTYQRIAANGHIRLSLAQMIV